MNSKKALFYLSPNSSESIKISLLGSLYINSQIFVLGLIVEGVQYFKGKYKEGQKVFWHEWVETTFAIWILAAIIVSVVQIYLRFK